MSTAMLMYELDSMKRVPVKVGSLSDIDNITLTVDTPALLMQKFKTPILTLLNDNKDYVRDNPDNKGRFVVDYIRDSDLKEELPVLYSHGKYRPILIQMTPVTIDEMHRLGERVSIVPSEIERARKLLLSSKNKKFLINFLRSDKFVSTTNFKMRVTKDEYDMARSSGAEGFFKNNQYGLSMREVLVYLYKNKKLGFMRVLVEDSLELWKSNLESINREDLYYYARNIRELIDNYYENINYKDKTVTNLNVNEQGLFRSMGSRIVTDMRYYTPLKSGRLIKIKLPKAG